MTIHPTTRKKIMRGIKSTKRGRARLTSIRKWNDRQYARTLRAMAARGIRINNQQE